MGNPTNVSDIEWLSWEEVVFLLAALNRPATLAAPSVSTVEFTKSRRVHMMVSEAFTWR